MKPYGRDGNIKGGNVGGNNWKKDYHIHSKKGRKILNWWEDIKDFCKKAARRNAKKQIKKDIEDGN